MGLDHVKLHLVRGFEDARELHQWFQNDVTPTGTLAIDTESTGLKWQGEDYVRTVQLGDANHGWMIPKEIWWGLFLDIMRQHEGPIDMMNAVFDYSMLKKAGVIIPQHRIQDVGVMSHVLEPHMSRALKSQTSRHVDPTAHAGQKFLDEAMEQNGWTWATVPWDYPWYWRYGALDPVLTYQLREHHWPLVQQQGATYAYELETAYQWVAMDMMTNGVHVDIPHVEQHLKQFQDYCISVEKWVKAEYGITPGSNQRVIEVLQRAGYQFSKQTEKGALSLDADVLEGIDHPLAQAVLTRRQLQKMVSTYLRFYLNNVDSNSLIHPSINTLGTRTGRCSMSEPNFQNLPVRGTGPGVKVVRNAITARPGNTLLFCDFDQIEMRGLAILSGDEGLRAAFHEPDDFFVTIARQIFQDPHLIKSDPRRSPTKNAMYAKCPHPATRVLTRNLEWIRAGELQVGQQLLGFDEHLQGVKGDHPRSRARRWRNTEVLGHRISLQPSVRLHMEDGSTLICSAEHQWLMNTTHTHTATWCEAKNLIPGINRIIRFIQPWQPNYSYDAGWLAGIMDGEGSIAQDSQHWNIAQKSTSVVASKIDDVLHNFNISHKKYGTNTKDIVNWYGTGPLRDILTTLGVIRPQRLINNLNLDGTSLWKESRLGVLVLAVEDAGLQECVEMETSTRTYFAEGFGSHNCYGAGIAKQATTAGVSYEQMLFINQQLDAAYPNIEGYIRHIYNLGMQQGYVQCPLTGRRHYADPGKEYALINYLVQGWAAAMFKQKQLELHAAGLGPYMILPVHDEIILDIETDLVPDAAQTLRKIMNDTSYPVPITASVSYGPRWGEKSEWVYT